MIGPSIVALLLCLLPGIGTMFWVVGTRNSPDQQIIAIFGATLIRLMVVACGGLLYAQTLPPENQRSFAAILVVVYLVTLAAETVLILRWRAK